MQSVLPVGRRGRKTLRTRANLVSTLSAMSGYVDLLRPGEVGRPQSVSLVLGGSACIAVMS
jgi:hypothetical protein